MNEKTAIALLEKLSQLGIKISLKNQQLSINAPKGILTTEIKNELASNKENLINLLKEQSTKIIPLSQAQKRMWFLQKLTPNSSAYNVFSVLKIKGNLELDILEKAINEIIKRHETLRSVIIEEDNKPLQKIYPEFELKLEYENLSTKEIVKTNDNIKELCKNEIEKIFDLKTPPLRSKVIKIGENEYLFILVIHHIIADAWSCGIFAQELIEIYQAFSKNTTYNLPEIKSSYAEYIEKQEVLSKSDELKNQLDYWKNYLTDIPPFVQLPSDKKRPEINNFRGEVYTTNIPENIKRGIEELAKKSAVTPFAIFISAHQILLHRYTHEEVIPVGFPIAGRNEKAYENLIGLFINTLVLKANFSNDISFSEFLTSNMENISNSFFNQDITFEKILEALNLKRSTSFTPIFQHLFVMQNIDFPKIEVQGTEFEFIDIHNDTSKFDTTFTIKNQNTQLSIEYNKELFELENIEQLVKSYFSLLESIIKNPDEKISKLNILDKSEYEKIVGENDFSEKLVNKATLGTCETINNLVEKNANKNPDKIAVTFENESLTYSELNNKAYFLAQKISDLGVKKGDYIGACFNVSLEMIISLLAILKLGCAYIPIDPNSPQDRIDFILEDSNPSALLIQENLNLDFSTKNILIIEKNFSAINDFKKPLIDVRNRLDCSSSINTTLENSSDFSQATNAENNPVRNRLDCSTDSSSKNKDENELSIENDYLKNSPVRNRLDCSSYETAYIIYTSGSTGKPKGTKVSHYNVMSLFNACKKSFHELDENDIWVLFHSFAFDYSIWEIWGCFYFGAKLILIEKNLTQNPEKFYQKICDEKVTVLNQTPSAFYYFSREAITQNLTNQLKYLVLSGEALDISLLSEWFNKFGDEKIKVINSYGITETTVFVTFRRIFEKDLHEKSRSPIGVALGHLKLYVLDKHQNLLPNGVSGELYVAGEGVSQGYLNRASLTDERFIKNPFGSGKLYKTGDHVRFTSNSEFEFFGRLDNQVKIRGFRIELGEIENTLNKIEEVKESFVTVKENSTVGKYLVAYLVIDKEKNFDQKRIQSFLRTKLTEIMVPHVYVVLEKFPINNNGKIDKTKLPEPNQNTTKEIKETFKPKNEIEQQVYKLIKELLQIDNLSTHDNFFDLGAHSLLMVEAHKKIQEQVGIKFELIDMFNYPSIATFSEYLAKKQAPIPSHNLSLNKVASAPCDNDMEGLKKAALVGSEYVETLNTCDKETEIAIIGMAGRFPQANDLEAFWHNLKNGVEAVKFFTDEELRALGVSEDLINNPKYVKANAVLEDFEFFDASFFGYSPREAEILDPQQRVFLECAYHALEDAGYIESSKNIGIFAGTAISRYLLFNLSKNQTIVDAVGQFQLLTSNDKDYLATRTAYKLNLKGPAITVQTACSTSLVAIHEACQSLLNNECEIALAGGISIDSNSSGYLYQEGSIASPDGHCRAFDKNSGGIVGGSGVGIIVLKKLTQALKDNDNIHAVIKGSAINNDGSNKIGFLAPSIEGQSEVIKEAIKKAQVHPETISYIEAHGTATPIGDPIEVLALTKAYNEYTNKKNYCALGSVKTNIGHLDMGAGVAGLIKTVLALKNKQIPASLHFQEPNPNINFKDSPFFVNNKLSEWVSNSPRRAGVSAFGVGGTNAHIILEEFVKTEIEKQINKKELIIISAKTENAFNELQKNVADFDYSNYHLAEVAHTFQTGRKNFNYKGFWIAENFDDLKAEPIKNYTEKKYYQTVFVFSGLGTQQLKMGEQLYDNEKVFRANFDFCCNLINVYLEKDLKEVIFNPDFLTLLNTPTYMQPAIFCFQYAMTKLWLSKNLNPNILIGHSFGEYLAWTFSGLISIEDMLKIVAFRGKLFEKISGSMLAVATNEKTLKAFLTNSLEIANYNSPDFITIAGTTEDIKEAQLKLKENKIASTLLTVPHATHNKLLEELMNDFRNELKNVAFHDIKTPIISNLTGGFLSKEEFGIDYIINHTLSPVHFYQGLQLLKKYDDLCFLEVGAGNPISQIIKRNKSNLPNYLSITSTPSKNSKEEEYTFFLKSLGSFWLNGFEINWTKEEKTQKISLPKYPFEKHKYWVYPDKDKKTVFREENKDWFFTSSWKKTLTPKHSIYSKEIFKENLLVLRGELIKNDFTEALKNYFNISEVIINEKPDFKNELAKLKESDNLPSKILYYMDSDNEKEYKNVYFNNIIDLIKEISYFSTKIELIIITNENYVINGNEKISPEKTLINGLVLSTPQEYKNIQCRNIDLDFSTSQENLALEIFKGSKEPFVAYRNNIRWVKNLTNLDLGDYEKNIPYQKGDNVIIVGGVGGIGFAIAELLATKYQVNLILLNRTFDNESIKESALFEKIELLKKQTEVFIIKTDITNSIELEQTFDLISTKFGTITQVIHSAGTISSGLIYNKTSEKTQAVFDTKIKSTKKLYELCQNYKVTKLVLFSSLSTILGGVAQSDYVSANTYLDSFTDSLENEISPQVICINWCTWKDVGMSAKMYEHNPELKNLLDTSLESISIKEGQEIFDQILSRDLNHVFISPLNIATLVEKYKNLSLANFDNLIKKLPKTIKTNFYPRPALKNNYVEPTLEIEKILVEIWQEALGINPIGIEDNFFDLGGHSLLFATMKIQLEEKLGYELPMSIVFNGNTIKELANHIEEKNSSVLVPLKNSGTKNPFFCVHAVSGTIFPFYDMVRNFEAERPFYALQSYGFSEKTEPLKTIEEMARFYLQAIKKLNSKNPYFLGGWSFGSLVALEMAQQLAQKNEPVDKLVVIDMQAPVGHEFRNAIDEKLLTERFITDMQGLFGKNVNLEDNNVKMLYKVFKNNIDASIKYEGKKYNGKIILFRATQNENQSETLGWDQLTNDLEIHNVDADHYSIIKSKAVFDILNGF